MTIHSYLYTSTSRSQLTKKVQGPLSACETTISIRRDGTLQFTRKAIGEFGPHDIDYVHFYRLSGGGGTRPLLHRERQELGAREPGPFARYSDDDPLEFLRLVGIKPRTRKFYRAWIELKTGTIMVQIE